MTSGIERMRSHKLNTSDNNKTKYPLIISIMHTVLTQGLVENFKVNFLSISRCLSGSIVNQEGKESLQHYMMSTVSTIDL